jgi:hypothetical protein
MKKFVLGLTCGIIVSISSVAYASDSIKAILFPAKFLINQVSIDPKDYSYEVLNYGGRTYVPIRFVAETMNSVVNYDEKAKLITVDNDFKIIDAAQSSTKAGHLNVVIEGNHSKMDIQIYTTKTDMGDEHTGEIVFWDDQGKVMEKVPYTFDLPKGTNIIKLQLVSKSDVSGYATATLTDITPIELMLPVPPSLDVQDQENKIKFGIRNSAGFYNGSYTVFPGMVSGTNQDEFAEIEATVTFYNDNNTILGTAPIYATLNGLDPVYVDFIGAGNLAKYKYTTIKLEKLVPIAKPSWIP